MRYELTLMARDKDWNAGTAELMLDTTEMSLPVELVGTNLAMTLPYLVERAHASLAWIQKAKLERDLTLAKEEQSENSKDNASS